MNREDIQIVLEAIAKGGTAVAGDLVIEKHVDYEVNNVEAGGIGIQVINGEVHETSEIHTGDDEDIKQPSWEEAIPEWLRTGKLLIAWNELRKAEILDDDYRLMNGGSKAEAHFLVTCFCQQKKKNTWKPFEDFWGFTDLKHGKGAFSKEQEDVIYVIFRNL